MAEPKRHMDVPQGACFGKAYPNLLPPKLEGLEKWK
jgi:hypothetical protein